MDVKSISKISFSKLSNPLHVSFMNSAIALINEHLAERLGMKETLLESFTKAVAAEQLIVSRTRASEHTKELEAYDKKRDNYFRAIIYRLRAILFETHLENQIPKDLAETIQTRLLNVYPMGIITDPSAVKSAKISGFIADIEQYIKEYVEAMGIKEDVRELAKANALFEQSYIGRVSERAQDVKAADCRNTSEALYTQCVYYIGGRANEFVDETTEEADEAQIAECRVCLDEFNQLIKEYKWKYSNSDTSKDPDEDDSETSLEAQVEEAA